MASLLELRKRFESLNIDQLAKESVEETKQELINTQRDQMLHGEKKDGSKIGTYKNKIYAARKFAQNPLAGIDNVDLNLTGEFQEEIFVDVRQQTLVIDSAANYEKVAKIFEMYGDPFGLNEKFIARYKSVSQKVLNKKIITKVTSK